jgi:hypothetical protein
MSFVANTSPTQDISAEIARWKGHSADLYWCPHCGFMIANRVSRKDLIGWCWGPCLEIYDEPIPLTFVRGLGPGRPENELPF